MIDDPEVRPELPTWSG